MADTTVNVNSTLVLRAGKTLYVDSVHGSDSTGTRERINRPYLTITAAKNAASSGDTIEVRPGTYNEYNLVKNGINYYFHPGARVVYTGTPSLSFLPAIFGAAEADTVATFGVYGHGDFVWDGAGGAGYVAYWQASNSVVRIHANNIESTGSDLFGCDTGTGVDIIMTARKGTSTGDAFYTALGGDGNVTMEIDQIDAGASLMIAEGSGGLITLKFDRCTCVRIGTCTAGEVILSGRDVLYSTDAAGLSHEGGVCRLIHLRVEGTDTDSVPISVSSSGLVIENCHIIAGSSATESIQSSAPQDVVCFGSYANKVPGSDISIQGNLTVGSFVV